MLLEVLANNPQTDIWHDPLVLAVIGVISTLLAGLIGAFVAYWIFRKQRRWKEISYEIISDTPIASVNWQVADRIDILFRGKRVEDTNLLVLNMWNSGNEAVKPEDYIEPITFKFGERIVLDADVLDMEPENLLSMKDIKTFLILERVETEPQDEIETIPMRKPNLKGFSLINSFLKDKISRQKTEHFNPNRIRLAKFLFQSNESISLKVILVGSKSKVYGSARIIDGKITEFDRNKQPAIIALREITLFTFGGILGYLLYIIIFPATLYIATIIALVAIICIWLRLLIYSIFQQRSQIMKNGIKVKW